MRSLESLSDFAPCPEGEIILCEVDGRLHSMKHEFANITAFTNAVDRHPNIHITRDMLHCAGSGDEGRALFLPVHEPFFKQVAQIWFEQGFTEALHLIAENRNRSENMKVIARWTLKFIDGVSRLQHIFQPNMHKDRKNLISNYSQTRNWSNSPIRCLAWHPHCTKIAVAASDDSIRIYSTDSTLVPILKSKLQKGVSCMAWRHLSASEIAVGCETCILIWTVDPNSVVTRPSTTNSFVLRRVNHCPISSIVWSPHGEYLVSASANDSSLLVWDVALDQTCTLRRAGTVGTTLLSWSKDGRRLIAASSGLVFRVWDCQRWTAERWNTVTSYMQSACWSPCGNILLFTTMDEPIVYSLCFEPGSVLLGSNISNRLFNQKTQCTTTSPVLATPVLEVSRIELENGTLIGGLVQAMKWDPKGRYLALIFRDTDAVALFTVQCKPQLLIVPSSLVTGLSGEVPSTISFQKNFLDGSCLSIAWSSGRLQHFPLIYSDSADHGSPLASSKSTNFESFRNYSSFRL